jgi:hypothetical protein
MVSSPAGLIGRAALGVAIGLATMGMARPSILASGYQFPSLDDGVLRQDGDAAQAGKAMNVSISGKATRRRTPTLRGQPDQGGMRSSGMALVRMS